VKVEWGTFYGRVVDAALETLAMVLVTLGIGSALGLLIGLLLYATRSGNLLANRPVFAALNLVINVVRPVPFIIFIVAIGPLTRLVVGTTIGTTAAIFAMTIVATFAIARVVENNLVAVDPGVIEAARAMGAGPVRIVVTVLLPEALGPLVLGLTFMLVALIDFSAMAGAVGGGGLGNLALVYGYQRYDWSVIGVTVLLLILFVQAAQALGNLLSRRLLRR
jgi:D-methionine transport system permease protein